MTAAPHRRDAEPRATAVQRVAAQTAMELRLLVRNGENLLVTFGIPLGLLVFLSVVPVLSSGASRGVDFLVPGVLVTSIIGSSLVSLGISTGFDRSYLVLKRLGATPLRRSELVAAKAIAVLAVQVAQVAAVVAVGVALGWRPDLGVAGVTAGAAALLLASVAFAGVGLAMAGSLPAMVTLAATNALFLVLMAGTGLVVPLDLLPEPVARAALVVPSTWAAAVLRGGGAGVTGSTPVALAVLGAWSVGAVAFAGRVFRWE